MQRGFAVMRCILAFFAFTLALPCPHTCETSTLRWNLPVGTLYIRNLQLRGGQQVESCQAVCDKEVLAFLTQSGLAQYAPAFAREKIRGHNIPELEKDDLQELGLSENDVSNFLSQVQKIALAPKDQKADIKADPQTSKGNAGRCLLQKR